MADLWTEKHDAGIQKILDALVQGLQDCKDASQVEAMLVRHGWRPGDKPTTTVQEGVKYTIGLWAKTIRLHELLSTVTLSKEDHQAASAQAKMRGKLKWPPKGHDSGPTAIGNLLQQTGDDDD